MKKRHIDLIFSSGSLQMSRVKTKVPVLIFTDAVIDDMIGYYPEYTGINSICMRMAQNGEKRAILNATKVVFASEWPIETAVKKYDNNRQKYVCINIGANINDSVKRNELDEILKRRHKNKISLLFVGVDWIRKGGAIALEAVMQINKQVPCSLNIVGCNPINELSSSEKKVVEIYPRLDKSKEDERQKLIELFKESDFFLLPTRAECAGIVFAEAAAYALPSIGTKTGGTTSMCIDGVSGYLLPTEAKAIDYANIILQLYEDRKSYNKLCETALELFYKEFSWEVVGSKFSGLIKEMLN